MLQLKVTVNVEMLLTFNTTNTECLMVNMLKVSLENPTGNMSSSNSLIVTGSTPWLASLQGDQLQGLKFCKDVQGLKYSQQMCW